MVIHEGDDGRKQVIPGAWGQVFRREQCFF